LKLARFTQLARSELLAQTAYYEALHRGLDGRFRADFELPKALCRLGEAIFRGIFR
jgi:hypothetical protein